MLKKLPNQIPIFPLSGVIYFPKTNLPLNIFEQRYLSMVENALKTSHRMIGIIQPKKKANKNDLSVYLTGCLGKIIKFEVDMASANAAEAVKKAGGEVLKIA